MRASRRLWAALACGIAMMLMFAATPASADKRLALVIGNSAYKNAPALRNPANDANDIADELTGKGK